jgi:hypothetical protein
VGQSWRRESTTRKECEEDTWSVEQLQIADRSVEGTHSVAWDDHLSSAELRCHMHQVPLPSFQLRQSFVADCRSSKDTASWLVQFQRSDERR